MTLLDAAPPPVDAPDPPAPAVEGPARRPWGRRALAVVVLALLAGLPAGLRVELAARRQDASEARAAAAGAAADRRHAEGRVARGEIRQDAADRRAADAAAAVAVERAGLEGLGLTEESLDRVAEGLRRDLEASEAVRALVAAGVAAQQVELPQLEQCLVAARGAIDAAFHASNDPGVAVPEPSEICRALAAALPTNAAAP